MILNPKLISRPSFAQGADCERLIQQKLRCRMSFKHRLGRMKTIPNSNLRLKDHPSLPSLRRNVTKIPISNRKESTFVFTTLVSATLVWLEAIWTFCRRKLCTKSSKSKFGKSQRCKAEDPQLRILVYHRRCPFTSLSRIKISRWGTSSESDETRDRTGRAAFRQNSSKLHSKN